MFEYKFEKAFSFELSDENGLKIPVENWCDYNDSYMSQLSILYELVDNGVAEFSENSCIVETSEILKLNEIDKQILGLPDDYPFDIYIQSDGQLNQNTFKFKFGFYDFAPNGTRFQINRNGPIISIEENNYLLSEKQFEICEALDHFNSLPELERNFQSNLKRFADIKSFSREAAATLDGYLQSQEVHSTSKIKIDIQFNDGILDIIPQIGIINEEAFLNTFDRLPAIREIYPVSGSSGNTTRIIISEDQKQELQKIKKIRKVEKSERIIEIVDNPEIFFDENTTDFSIFYSERVKEIGIYKPKFYPFVCPYKSEWIPGIEIRDKVDGVKRIYLKTLDNLSEFIDLKEIAIKNGKQSVEWDNVDIPLQDAEMLISNAEKQFKNPQKPIKSERNNTDNQVLIIKENAELTEFIENSETPISLIHSFSEIDNLKKGISLKEHQTEGVSWLQTLYKENLSGCLLADDMGLGKTLQLLYFIEWHNKTNSSVHKPYLIVAPVSLLENWENEYQKFFEPQTLELTKLYGNTSLTKSFDHTLNTLEANQLQRKHIILTNYETLRSYQATLCLVDFAVVALDEAQKIKTPGTLVTNASKALKADFKIAMTGTPVENTLIDIWCIMDFSVPGLLGNAKDFAKEYQNPLKEEHTDIKTLTEGLRNKIGVFIKRRLKIDVAQDLPKKLEKKDSSFTKVMPAIQLNRYKIEIETAKSTENTNNDGRNQKLKSLWAIRDISDHPYLLDHQILNFSSEELIATSAKLQITIGILENVKLKKEKVIVFADRKETQKMLQKVIYDCFGLLPSIVNGDTPSTKQREDKAKLSRQQTIDRFQEEDGFNIIIMSPLAAGVGLNVTEANHVIHYSRHWNPAKEQQATDRAYRIGQKKEVHVYYPMAIFPDEMQNDRGEKQKSFDEILDNLLENKKSLASNTLFPTEQAEVRPDELFGDIFGFEPDINYTPITINQLDNLSSNLFEAAIAAIFENQGFEVYLTPYSNDKGVDIVLISENKNYLIQVKQTRSLVGRDAIQEVFTAKNYYENKFGKSFQLKVITNNGYSSTATLLGSSNSVELMDRNVLIDLINKNTLTMKDISIIESKRLEKI